MNEKYIHQCPSLFLFGASGRRNTAYPLSSVSPVRISVSALQGIAVKPLTSTIGFFFSCNLFTQFVIFTPLFSEEIISV